MHLHHEGITFLTPATNFRATALDEAMKLSLILSLTVVVFASSANAVTPMLSRVLNDLTRQIQLRPNVSNGIVGLVLFGTSDVFAQQLEKAQGEARENSGKTLLSLVSLPTSDGIDMRRFLSAAFTGACFGGAIYPFAYRRLEGVFQGKDFLSICKKSVLEIFTLGVFANTVSMASRGVLKGHDPNQVMAHVTRQLPKVTLHDFGVWFPYNLVLFGFVPMSVRPAATSLMDTCWQTYISLQSNDYDKNETAEKTAIAMTSTATLLSGIPLS